MGNPRWLVSVGQSAREERPVQRRNSGDLQRVFRVLTGATNAGERTIEKTRVTAFSTHRELGRQPVPNSLYWENS